MLFVLLASCATVKIHSTEDIIQSPQAISLRVSGNPVEPSTTNFVMNDKGEAFLDLRNQKCNETKFYRISRKKNIEFWQLVNDLPLDSLKDQYQIANNSEVVALSFYQEGELRKQIRYSAGAPQQLKAIKNYISEHLIIE